MTSIKLNDGRTLTIGDSLIIVDSSLGGPFRPVGKKFKVGALTNDGDIHIGIFSEKPVDGWHDLGGKVPMGHGYWLGVGDVARFFDLVVTDYVIKSSMIYKNIELKGKKCSLLRLMSDDLMLIEFEENIGGGSGDGLGKKGHCIIVSSSMLEEAKKEKNKSGK